MIALDWDSVLIDHPCNIDWEEILTYGPMKDAVKVINYLVGEGVEFCVLTARPESKHKDICKWLTTHGFPEMEVTNIKKSATMYIDDRSFRFTNWQDISKLLR